MKLVDFGVLAATKGTVAMREEGIVVAAMGTTALSANDRYWAVKFNFGCGPTGTVNFWIDTK